MIKTRIRKQAIGNVIKLISSERITLQNEFGVKYVDSFRSYLPTISLCIDRIIDHLMSKALTVTITIKNATIQEDKRADR